jgi:transmembrane sensor
MDESRDLNRDDELFAEANRWFFRMQAEDVTAAERAALASWLAADPRHARVMGEIETLLGALKDPAKASHRAAQAGQDLRPSSAGGERRTARWLAAGLAAALALFAYVQGPVLLARWNADLLTVAGERASRRLADGTQVELSSDTALKVEISETQRRITLLRGEAFFEIANDPRPLLVRTEAGEVRDIGTGFSVAKTGAGVLVTVESGIVDVASRHGETARITAGQRVAFDSSGIAPVSKADLDEALAWRRGQVVFRQQRLADVVAILNRHRAGRIVIVNPWIRDLRVSGAFDIDRSASAIEALETVLGVRAVRLSPYLVMLR